MKEKIEKFVDEAIKNNDYKLLDILWMFFYSLPSKSGYHNNKEGFKKWLGKICRRNLYKKYNFKQNELRAKMENLIDLLNNLPDFLSYETYDEDKKLLSEILIEKSSKFLVQNSTNHLHNLSDLNKKILSFALNYIPIRIQDSLKKAENDDFWYKYKYAPLSDFEIDADEETYNVVYYKINLKKWTYLFNLLFNEELKEQRFKTKSYKKRSARLILFPSEQHEEYSFWQFGDELVKIGVGYWIFSISAKGNVDIEFIIPNLIYEDIKTYKEHLPIVENFIGRINEIKNSRKNEKVKKEWGLEELEETEAISEVLESEIESSIISNPEILEEGLELIGNQYSTSIGYIDILCRDKNGNYVIIELKRGKGSHKVVGQIQKYMVWVSENLTKDKQVRGIIVVKEYAKELEYAIKGSKFPIEIKMFGQEPPTEENIKYCGGCGKINKKSAKYCIKCGQEFWM